MDREKAINDLLEVREYIARKVHDLASRQCRMMDKITDVLELLKEQEAPSKEELIAHYGKMYKCRRCGLEWYQQTQKYCQECGTVVKWE